MHNSNESKHTWASLVIKIIYFLNIIIILHSNLINGAPLSLSASSSSSLVGKKSTVLDGKYKINNLNTVDGSDTNYTNLTRQHDGDIFSANDISKCNVDTCVGLSSGTASLLVTENKKSDARTQTIPDDSNQDGCTCRCHSYLSTYREDLGICVDDIRECTLSPFISGSSTEKIPFVFLPLRGQIIYPSREISFAEIQTPICAVTGSQYLTSNGWADLRNPIDTDLPFRMFRDEGRTFLQWLGEPELRHKMQGRLVLIHLMCRDMSFSNNKSTLNNDPNSNVITNNIFTPCVAFRINGSPVKYIHNVSEVLFQSEASSNLSAVADGLSAREYIVIGVCSLLLGLIYVASVFLYLHVKKRKNLSSEPARSSIDDLDNDINYPKNDQVTFGVPFTRTGSSYSVNSINDHRNSQRSHSRSLNSPVGGLKEDIGIIKNNPLLKHFPSLSDHSGFTSDLSNSNSEFEDNQSNKNEKLKISQTSAVVHPSNNNKNEMERNIIQESSPSPTQENECLPEANVSIIEEVGSDERQLENMRALVNGTVRKKLYFNPAYFEPHLLLSPPPAAIEFLTKIREVIAIAKYKMASKRYQPQLGAILEEIRSEGSETSSKKINQKYYKQIVNYAQVDDTKKQLGFSNDNRGLEIINSTVNNNNNKNIGDKANSIQKWLETVSPPNETINKSFNQNAAKSNSNSSTVNSPKNIVSKDTLTKTEQKHDINRSIGKLSPPKVKPPPIPDTTARSGIYTTNMKSNLSSQKEERTIEIIRPIHETQSHVIYNQEKPITPVLVGRHFDANPVYQFTDARIEIYNNPKFNHVDSPQPSQKSRSTRSKSSKKRMEVLDQYSNPQKLEPSHYELMKNIKQMPDMVYEALAKDYSRGVYSSSSRPNSQTFNIPTPDYDSTLDKKIKNIYNNSQNGSIIVPPVPTPDYSSLGKRSNGRMYQPPDSPIYRRKSPQYLIVDYETDSLERSTHPTRKCSSSSSPISNNSSEISSQPSPSLSTALPLEEEVEIRHTVYDKVEGFRKDGDINLKKKGSKNISEYEDVHNGKKKLEPLIKYDTPFRGSMTIEVQHEPLSDFEPSTDSDQFEPDTLDRKPKKHSFCDVKSADAWSEHLKKSKNFVNSAEEKISYSSLENMTSLPDFGSSYGKNNSLKNCLILKSSSSFRSNIETVNKRNINSKFDDTDHNLLESRPSFGSLREIYQSKAHRNPHQRPKLKNIDFQSEQGRLLTLEIKHAKRQRQIQEKDKNSKVLPPDVVPTTAISTNTSSTNSSSDNKENGDKKLYYDIKKSIRNSSKFGCKDENSIKKESIKNLRKNFQGWNTDNFSGNHNDIIDNKSNNSINKNNNNNNNNNNNIKNDTDYYSHDDTEETLSNHSESTEITGVSDTQVNSEFEDESKSIDNTKKKQLNNSKKHKNKFRKTFIVNLPVSNTNTNNNSDETNSNNSNDKSAIHKNLNSINSPLLSPTNSSKFISKNKYGDLNGDFSYDRYLNRKKKQEQQQQQQNKEQQNQQDITNNKFEKSKIENNNKIINSTDSNKYSKDLIYPDQNSNVKQVYRVEIESPMNGMQIAMGLKDRSKKSKDIKNAWKRFVCLATSKISPNSTPKLNDNFVLKNDDKNPLKPASNDINISSTEQQSQPKLGVISMPINKTGKLINGRFNLYEQNIQFNGHYKHELDSGYMSADSSEVYARRYYDRFNFKTMSETENILMTDTIEDNPEKIINNQSDSNDHNNKMHNSNEKMSSKNENNKINKNCNMNVKTSIKENISYNIENKNENINKNKNIDNRYHNQYNCMEDENIAVTASESDDDGGNTEDLSESGAESVETHSVFFKNIRKKS